MSSQHTVDSPVLVVAPSRRNIRRALHRLKGERFRWAYIGQNLSQYKAAQKSFKHMGTYIDSTDQFHQAGHDLREQYLNYFYEIGKEQNSLRWWITSLAQSNCYICKTMHQVCYLKVGLDLSVAQENQGHWY